MDIDRAIQLGFDRTVLHPETDDDYAHLQIRCSQCEVLVINGTPTHESGCPHQTHECKGCDTIVPRGVRYCEDCR